jgi:3-methyladenine DNA glycosylase AlkD
MVITEEIRKDLPEMRDEKYRDFQSKLIPTVSAETVIGVRTPELRKYAKLLAKREDVAQFLSDLPHHYFDENQLHAFIISESKAYERCIEEGLLDTWTHNKTIQKSVESYRITPEQKQYLKSLKKRQLDRNA